MDVQGNHKIHHSSKNMKPYFILFVVYSSKVVVNIKRKAQSNSSFCEHNDMKQGMELVHNSIFIQVRAALYVGCRHDKACSTFEPELTV